MDLRRTRAPFSPCRNLIFFSSLVLGINLFLRTPAAPFPSLCLSSDHLFYWVRLLPLPLFPPSGPPLLQINTLPPAANLSVFLLFGRHALFPRRFFTYSLPFESGKISSCAPFFFGLLPSFCMSSSVVLLPPFLCLFFIVFRTMLATFHPPDALRNPFSGPKKNLPPPPLSASSPDMTFPLPKRVKSEYPFSPFQSPLFIK